jgi:rhodanese-related sulfurtransferase
VVERVQLTNPTTCSSTSAPTAGLFVHLARLRAELPALQIVDIRGPGEAANGFGDVSNLLGGLRAWVAAGQPVTVPAAG